MAEIGASRQVAVAHSGDGREAEVQAATGGRRIALCKERMSAQLVDRPVHEREEHPQQQVHGEHAEHGLEGHRLRGAHEAHDPDHDRRRCERHEKPIDDARPTTVDRSVRRFHNAHQGQCRDRYRSRSQHGRFGLDDPQREQERRPEQAGDQQLLPRCGTGDPLDREGCEDRREQQRVAPCARAAERSLARSAGH